MAGSLSDITTRKEVELELRLSRQRAEDTTRTKSQFPANMSHELRTPMNAIIGITEMLKEEAEDEGDDARVEPLSRICSASRHMLRLINDILDLSKIEAGRLELNVESFEIETLVEDLAVTGQLLAEKNHNGFDVSYPEQIGVMCSDMTRVRQILLNLIANVCKFTQNGEITLSVKIDGEDLIAFDVLDTGIGMTEEQLASLFE